MRFRSDPSAIRGSIAPLVTPFQDDGSLDLAAVARLVEWQLARGTHGISVGGSTGEPTTQTTEERIAVMAAAAAAIDDRCPFLPATGAGRLEDTLQLTAEAGRLGADAVLVVAPYYSRPTQEGLRAWYSTIAAEFPELPLILYNVPIRSAVDIAPATVARLRRDHANVVGIKETTKDFEHVSYVLHECGEDFLAYSGIELLCYPMLAIGGAGHLSCVANVAPQPVAALYDSFVAGDQAAARGLHYALHPLVELAFLETNPAPVKWAMQSLGLLESGRTRPPLAALSAPAQRRAAEILTASSHLCDPPPPTAGHPLS